ncbi:peptide-methionine (S)-S-oxide reductase MsrA [Candidatus Woesearchaeota archaeon]|jgi:methionine-S-sulfoxide reductase|nr:peptide-methionine (S)-S-oxide reductase MsrA [Candidatus Woesearchaeota archaeon]MBT5397076.1 peptide-methionine (S)-S-oxide reductase MsrA [Candidatus Woesearchaeota archaeon]MBT6367378.1 peptide-methionine (S)-S-oxide reductase MsrA [Candidatus Woesearchaeota archaeon]MBT7762476.1 peptide-methionine (S)-S-oxide reductase MsrA [Candidatus Woesearchaeota archaeon]
MKWTIVLIAMILVGCAQEIPESEVPSEADVATFAGGCFWCMEAAFQGYAGVFDVISGYAGGDVKDPTYEHVLSGKTGHRESVQVFYDKSVISYEELVRLFWRQIEPTDAGGQFSDRGEQYTTAIFYHTEKQKVAAEKSKSEIAKKFTEPIATQIIPFTTFYKAEEYHQDYSLKRTRQYEQYAKGSGRKGYIERVWGK